jgi:DNA/RNA endonuclease G (NUC1)
MKKLLFLCLLITGSLMAQTVDTVIVTPIYKSYFSYQTKTPLFVAYNLYKGGGKCSRKGMTFKTGGLKYSATEADYKAGGFDEGHIADFSDFSYSIQVGESTFRFYNCIPQTARLNRGIWKSYETNIRKQSQSDSLLIIAGGYSFTTKMRTVSVPTYCFKIVQSLTTKQIHCYIFSNDNSNSVKEVSKEQLYSFIPNISKQVDILLKK